MKLAMFQMENAGSIQKNLEKSLNAVRTAAEQGADLILFPEVQLTEFFPQYQGRDVSLYGVSLESDIVKAFQNSVAVAMCNRVVREDGMDFAGESLVVSAEGETLIKVDDKERIIYADIDLRESTKIRQAKPYISLRRTEWYL